jgi:hypothetical protein
MVMGDYPFLFDQLGTRKFKIRWLCRFNILNGDRFEYGSFMVKVVGDGWNLGKLK